MACSSIEGKCFSEWPDSPVTLKYPPATSVLNENPAFIHLILKTKFLFSVNISPIC